jgi:hypothetical protein
VIGQLCAHTYCSSILPRFNDALYPGAPLCKIWPLTGWNIDCRYLPVMSDNAVVSLSEALARDTPPASHR